MATELESVHVPLVIQSVEDDEDIEPDSLVCDEESKDCDTSDNVTDDSETYEEVHVITDDSEDSSSDQDKSRCTDQDSEDHSSEHSSANLEECADGREESNANQVLPNEGPNPDDVFDLEDVRDGGGTAESASSPLDNERSRTFDRRTSRSKDGKSALEEEILRDVQDVLDLKDESKAVVHRPTDTHANHNEEPTPVMEDLEDLEAEHVKDEHEVKTRTFTRSTSRSSVSSQMSISYYIELDNDMSSSFPTARSNRSFVEQKRNHKTEGRFEEKESIPKSSRPSYVMSQSMDCSRSNSQSSGVSYFVDFSESEVSTEPNRRALLRKNQKAFEESSRQIKQCFKKIDKFLETNKSSAPSRPHAMKKASPQNDSKRRPMSAVVEGHTEKPVLRREKTFDLDPTPVLRAVEVSIDKREDRTERKTECWTADSLHCNVAVNKPVKERKTTFKNLASKKSAHDRFKVNYARPSKMSSPCSWFISGETDNDAMTTSCFADSGTIERNVRKVRDEDRVNFGQTFPSPRRFERIKSRGVQTSLVQQYQEKKDKSVGVRERPQAYFLPCEAETEPKAKEDRILIDLEVEETTPTSLQEALRRRRPDYIARSKSREQDRLAKSMVAANKSAVTAMQNVSEREASFSKSKVIKSSASSNSIGLGKTSTSNAVNRPSACNAPKKTSTSNVMSRSLVCNTGNKISSGTNSRCSTSNAMTRTYRVNSIGSSRPSSSDEKTSTASSSSSRSRIPKPSTARSTIQRDIVFDSGKGRQLPRETLTDPDQNRGKYSREMLVDPRTTPNKFSPDTDGRPDRKAAIVRSSYKPSPRLFHSRPRKPDEGMRSNSERPMRVRVT